MVRHESVGKAEQFALFVGKLGNEPARAALPAPSQSLRRVSQDHRGKNREKIQRTRNRANPGQKYRLDVRKNEDPQIFWRRGVV